MRMGRVLSEAKRALEEMAGDGRGVQFSLAPRDFDEDVTLFQSAARTFRTLEVTCLFDGSASTVASDKELQSWRDVVDDVLVEHEDEHAFTRIRFISQRAVGNIDSLPAEEQERAERLVESLKRRGVGSSHLFTALADSGVFSREDEALLRAVQTEFDG